MKFSGGIKKYPYIENCLVYIIFCCNFSVFMRLHTNKTWSIMVLVMIFYLVSNNGLLFSLARFFLSFASFFLPSLFVSCLFHIFSQSPWITWITIILWIENGNCDSLKTLCVFTRCKWDFGRFGERKLSLHCKLADEFTYVSLD